jgi:hypothetical protein
MSIPNKRVARHRLYMYVFNGLSVHRARVSHSSCDAVPTVLTLEISLRADCDRSITRQPRSFATERERNWDVKSRDFNCLCLSYICTSETE